MRVISKSNASSLPFGGVTHEPGADGVFDVPEHVGRELTIKHASLWVAETVHLAAITAAEIDKLRDPNHLVTTVVDLIKRVADLEASAAAAAKPKTKAPAAETPPPITGEKPAATEPKKQTAAQKRAAAKKTAAAKPARAAKPSAEESADDEHGQDGEQSEPETPARPTAAHIKERDDPAWP